MSALPEHAQRVTGLEPLSTTTTARPLEVPVNVMTCVVTDATFVTAPVAVPLAVES